MDAPPVIDVAALGPLDAPFDADAAAVARRIDEACRRVGFLVVTGHGIDPTLQDRLDAAARRTFALPDEVKAELAMRHSGRAWRGWFPEGGELTAGRPDRKEGLYFGDDLPADDPRVRAGLPLHGANRYPAAVPELAELVPMWMDAVADLGQRLLRAIAHALGLGPRWFLDHLTDPPTRLFRIFRYPPAPPGDGSWGVGEHTDYGLLTLLAHDGTPGLEVRTDTGWVAVPSVPGSFVVNLGDMLERMTGGAYRSTPHRVRHEATGDRLSFPLFLDPGWDAEIRPVPGLGDRTDDARGRWDGTSVHRWEGTYGEYLTAKVAKVFPDLGDEVLNPS